MEDGGEGLRFRLAPAKVTIASYPRKQESKVTMKTTGNTILITGGGSGIGRGLAEAFHALGNHVIIAGRRKQVLDATTAANPGITSLALDIENPVNIRSFAGQMATRNPSLPLIFSDPSV
jgi:uncharacterized oxidoreductase